MDPHGEERGKAARLDPCPGAFQRTALRKPPIPSVAFATPKCFRRVGLWILPVALRGSASTNLISARALEAREVGLAMRVDLRFGVMRVARLDRDDRHAGLAPLFAGNADHGGLRDRRELVQHVLDLGRIDVLAAGDVHVLPAVDDVVEAFVVDPRGVAGVQPAVGEGRGVGVRPVPVARRDVRPLDP